MPKALAPTPMARNSLLYLGASCARTVPVTTIAVRPNVTLRIPFTLKVFILFPIDAASNGWWPRSLPRIYPNFGTRMARLPRIPDLLTTANLACGVASILLASQGQLTIACGLIFVAALFDVLDGLAARALGGGSPLGAQLDSLADRVSFGVAPAFIAAISPIESLQLVTTLHREYSPTASLTRELFGQPLWASITSALLIAIASAWRLAKFNIDTRQSTGFL